MLARIAPDFGSCQKSLPRVNVCLKGRLSQRTTMTIGGRSLTPQDFGRGLHECDVQMCQPCDFLAGLPPAALCWQSENCRPTWRCHHVTIHDAQQRLSAHVVAITSWSICLEQERRRERARAILHVHCANVRRVEADARVGQAAPGSSRPAMCSVALSSTKPFKAGQVRFRVAACPLGSMSARQHVRYPAHHCKDAALGYCSHSRYDALEAWPDMAIAQRASHTLRSCCMRPHPAYCAGSCFAVSSVCCELRRCWPHVDIQAATANKTEANATLRLAV